MKKFNATEFKAKCLKLLDQLGPDGIIITKHGHPVAKVLPIKTKSMQSLYGCMKDEIKVKGDLLSTGVEWNAQS